jgi:menaquinone reductase, multiheme cytochrome c subunit
MSTFDDKAGDVSTEAVDEVPAAVAHESKQPDSAAGPAGPLILLFIVGLAVSMAVGWGLFPELLYSQKRQPLDFNHKLHVAKVKHGCESCHYFRADGSFSGIPGIKDCVKCHKEEQGQSKDEAVFVTQYVRKHREVPWLSYSRQPDCVFFSHAAHVKMAHMKCEACHGHIGESKSTRIYEQNRISGYSRDIWGQQISGIGKDTWDRMKMDDCAVCHARMIGQRTSAQTQNEACFVCHK